MNNLNSHVATKQYFRKRVQKTTFYEGCMDCDNNDIGFCKKFNKWCYLCSHNCDPQGKPHTYSYKPQHDKWRRIKY